MKVKAFIALCAFGLAIMSGQSFGQSSMGSMHEQPVAVNPDARELMPLAPATVVELRSEMRDMLVSLSKVLDLLASGQRAEAGKVLEQELGASSMSNHPGMMKAAIEMPEGARILGGHLHHEASEMARHLGAGGPDTTVVDLQRIVASCTACHLSYRAR